MTSKIEREKTLRAQAMSLPEPHTRIVLAYLAGIAPAAVESGLEFLAAIDLDGAQLAPPPELCVRCDTDPVITPGETRPGGQHLTLNAMYCAGCRAEAAGVAWEGDHAWLTFDTEPALDLGPCGAESEPMVLGSPTSRYMCSEPPGHDGPDHIARVEGREVYRWPVTTPDGVFMCGCGTHFPWPTAGTGQLCPNCYTTWELDPVSGSARIKTPNVAMFRDGAGEVRSAKADEPAVIVEVDTGREVAGPMPAIDAVTWLNQHWHEHTSALQLVPVSERPQDSDRNGGCGARLASSESMSGSFGCTEARGHAGDHVAGGSRDADEPPLTWPQTPANGTVTIAEVPW